MPVALSTTKRKFHRVLDSISNASSVSLASGNEKHNASTTVLPAYNDPPAKKPRVARPASAYVPKDARTVVLESTQRRPASIVQQPEQARMNNNSTPPNFAPWDRGQFMGRLKTYRHVDKWRGKPEEINEVQWSKRGWSCVGKEKVCCVGGCSKEVVITLEDDDEEKPQVEDETADPQSSDEHEEDWREKAYEELVKKYAEMIITAHDEGCFWRRRGCDDTIQRLPLVNRDSAIESLRQRYASLAAMSSELPPNPEVPSEFDFSVIHDQLSTLLQPPCISQDSQAMSPESPINSQAVPALISPAAVLALFGWQAEEGHIPGLATCTACFRRLGLWLFKPSSDNSTPSSMDRLDVVSEHRDFCPWINSLSQNGSASRRTSLEGLAGWQALLRTVQAYTLQKKDDSEEIAAGSPQKPPEDSISDVSTVISLGTIKEDRKGIDEKDKERWAKLKRLRQVFHVKRLKEKSSKMGKMTG
ncbi:hypothetical protein ACLMJK_007763 [Lecanora helva]